MATPAGQVRASPAGSHLVVSLPASEGREGNNQGLPLLTSRSPGANIYGGTLAMTPGGIRSPGPLSPGPYSPGPYSPGMLSRTAPGLSPSKSRSLKEKVGGKGETYVCHLYQQFSVQMIEPYANVYTVSSSSITNRVQDKLGRWVVCARSMNDVLA